MKTFVVLSSRLAHCQSSLGSHDECQAATNPQTKPDLGCESTCRLSPSTPTVAIYYHYSAQQLILILPFHKG